MSEMAISHYLTRIGYSSGGSDNFRVADKPREVVGGLTRSANLHRCGMQPVNACSPGDECSEGTRQSQDQKIFLHKGASIVPSLYRERREGGRRGYGDKPRGSDSDRVYSCRRAAAAFAAATELECQARK
jgi:hypothetical protein